MKNAQPLLSADALRMRSDDVYRPLPDQSDDMYRQRLDQGDDGNFRHKLAEQPQWRGWLSDGDDVRLAFHNFRLHDASMGSCFKDDGRLASHTVRLHDAFMGGVFKDDGDDDAWNAMIIFNLEDWS
jgi:hypothetical protein